MLTHPPNWLLGRSLALCVLSLARRPEVDVLHSPAANDEILGGHTVAAAQILWKEIGTNENLEDRIRKEAPVLAATPLTTQDPSLRNESNEVAKAVKAVQQVNLRPSKATQGKPIELDLGLGKPEDAGGLREGTPGLMSEVLKCSEIECRLRILALFLTKHCADEDKPLDKRTIDFIRTYLVFPVQELLRPRKGNPTANYLESLRTALVVGAKTAGSARGSDDKRLMDEILQRFCPAKTRKASIEQAFEGNPSRGQCLALQLVSWQRRGNIKLAAAWFDKACAAWPGDPSLYLSRALDFDKENQCPLPVAVCNSVSARGKVVNPIGELAGDVWKLAARRLEPTDRRVRVKPSCSSVGRNPPV